MSERSVATWGPLPSLCVLGMLYTITRYRDTTKYSNSPFHERVRFYHSRCLGLSSASLIPILSVQRDGKG
jgi:hypothetical protein